MSAAFVPSHCSRRVERLDAVRVGAPGGDALLDLAWSEVVAEGAGDKGRKLGVGGEAERDDLPQGEVGAGGEGVGWQQSSKPKALFEANDAILDLEVLGAGV